MHHPAAKRMDTVRAARGKSSRWMWLPGVVPKPETPDPVFGGDDGGVSPDAKAAASIPARGKSSDATPEEVPSCRNTAFTETKHAEKKDPREKDETLDLAPDKSHQHHPRDPEHERETEREHSTAEAAILRKRRGEGQSITRRRCSPRKTAPVQYAKLAGLTDECDDEVASEDCWSIESDDTHSTAKGSKRHSKGKDAPVGAAPNGQQKAHRDKQWADQYQRLMEFKTKHGHTRVPQGYNADPGLATWVKKQRNSCKNIHRIKRLNDIGFEWRLQNSNHWMTMYDRLVAYKEAHGTAWVPHGCQEDPDLGRWAHAQRHFCKNSDRIDLLNDIGFVWSREVCETRWMDMYRRLQAYQKEHGTTRVSETHDPELARWVSGQRPGCRHKHRIEKLKRLGFVWTKPAAEEWYETRWMDMYRRLETYQKEHGTTRIPVSYHKVDPKLVNWVNNQRRYCKRDDRIKMLDSISFVWRLR